MYQSKKPYLYGTGRRKSSVARVHLFPNGTGSIIINAAQAVLTGKKGEQKFYRHHSGWVGGLKETPYRILMQEKPELAMRVAIKGMLPKNTLGKAALGRVHIYADANYEQQAQKPVVLD